MSEMIKPKTLGPDIKKDVMIPSNRRKDITVIVPQTEQIRKVEAFDATPAEGVQEIITGENSSFRFLRLVRIFMTNPGHVERQLKQEEAVYYINRGEATLETDNQSFTLRKGDVLYVGIESYVRISNTVFCDISEFKAVDCHTKYPPQLVRHTDIEDTQLAANLGTRRLMSRRTVYKLVDKNVQANRLLFGDTYMASRGGVGSYPPHFHGPDGPHGLGQNAKEEIYHFRCESDIEDDVPYVLQNCALPEEKVNVYAHIFDNVAINVTPTYHDTIAPPSVDFMFTWCLASFTEGHRDWAEIYNKPGYENEW
jgi:4-deoxy-L-threo-5-hexosulose-uronate ketol-isomerase